MFKAGDTIICMVEHTNLIGVRAIYKNTYTVAHTDFARPEMVWVIDEKYCFKNKYFKLYEPVIIKTEADYYTWLAKR